MRRWLLAGLFCLASMAAHAADNALWIDVRSPEEFAAGHLEGAVNIPYDEIATRIGSVQPDRKAPIKLYCGIGVRAQMAKFSLEAQGYERVSNEGGYAAIVEAQAACRQDATKC